MVCLICTNMLGQTDVFLVLFLCQLVVSSKGVSLLVESNVGSIRGLPANDGNYSMFLGIPYAAVDKDNPFGESTPYPNFNETYEAYDNSAKCPQLFNGKIVGSLSCLHLNIYVPSSATSNNSLPVMVFIHGGAFLHYFAGRYGPKYLVRHDVILVTLNYRLGPYGFMCLDIPEVSGNQGLKDQLIALRWAKNNIEAFGGDANKITLSGQSAGGFSVHLHLMSPKEILYNKIIIQSGIRALAPDVIGSPNNSVPLKLAQYLGSETSDVHEALSFLAKCNTSLVTEAVRNLSLVFSSCKELELDGVNQIITQHYYDAESTKVKNIPILIGFNEHEIPRNHVANVDYSKSLDLISRYLNQSLDNETLEDMKTIVGHFYFGDDGAEVNLTLEAANFFSDYVFIHPIQKIVRKYLDSGPENIFYYMFSYVGGLNLLPYSTSHSDDLNYLFDLSPMMPQTTTRTREDRITIDRMTTMWTNFAKYSNPTPNTTDLLRVKWLPVTKESYYYLKIDKELYLGKRPLHRRMAFWDMFDRLMTKSQI